MLSILFSTFHDNKYRSSTVNSYLPLLTEFITIFALNFVFPQCQKKTKFKMKIIIEHKVGWFMIEEKFSVPE